MKEKEKNHGASLTAKFSVTDDVLMRDIMGGRPPLLHLLPEDISLGCCACLTDAAGPQFSKERLLVHMAAHLLGEAMQRYMENTGDRKGAIAMLRETMATLGILSMENSLKNFVDGFSENDPKPPTEPWT